MGIPTRGQEQPAYTWEDISSFRESDPLVNTKENVKPLSSRQSDPIRYIPTDIRGDPEFVKAVTELCTEYIDIFSTVVSEEPARVPPMELEVDTTLWERNANKGPPRKQTPDKHEAIVRETDKLVQHKIIAPSQAEYYSQVNMVPKPVYTHRSEELNVPDKVVKAKGWRTTIDYRNLNIASKGMGWPLPNIKEVLIRLGMHRPKYFGKLDFTSGYHQIPLDKKSWKYTAFITFRGIFEWMRVPMGLKGAPSFFQGILVSLVLAGLIYIICELYIDDLIIHSQTTDDFLERLRQVFARLRKYNVKVHPDKCQLGLTEVEYVGHTINATGMSFSRERIEKVLDITEPILGKDLKSFLGVAVYFIDHIRNYSSIVRPLHQMLHNYERNRRLQWTQEGRDAFNDIKKAINELPTLFFLNDKDPIILMTDASDFGVGGYLTQIVDGKELPIAFVSKSLTPVEVRWSTIEKECYAIVYTLKKLHYLLGDQQFVLRTDHKNLT
jgi:hypothetical protein